MKPLYKLSDDEYDYIIEEVIRTIYFHMEYDSNGADIINVVCDDITVQVGYEYSIRHYDGSYDEPSYTTTNVEVQFRKAFDNIDKKHEYRLEDAVLEAIEDIDADSINNYEPYRRKQA